LRLKAPPPVRATRPVGNPETSLAVKPNPVVGLATAVDVPSEKRRNNAADANSNRRNCFSDLVRIARACMRITRTSFFAPSLEPNDRNLRTELDRSENPPSDLDEMCVVGPVSICRCTDE
jgi:hypothetical protein